MKIVLFLILPIFQASYVGFDLVGSISVDDLIYDSTVNPSQTFLLATTKSKGIIVFSYSMNPFPQLSELYAFNSFGAPILIRALDDNFACIISNMSNSMSSQIMEIFSYHTNSSTRIAFLNFSSSSNIVDLVISGDSQLI